MRDAEKTSKICTLTLKQCTKGFILHIKKYVILSVADRYMPDKICLFDFGIILKFKTVPLSALSLIKLFTRGGKHTLLLTQESRTVQTAL